MGESHKKICARDITKVKRPPPTQVHSKDTAVCLPRPAFSLSSPAAPVRTLLLPRAKAKGRRSSSPPPQPVPHCPSTHRGHTSSSPALFRLPPRHNHSGIIQVTSPSRKRSWAEFFLIQNRQKERQFYLRVKTFYRGNFLFYFLVTGFEFFSVRVNSGICSFLPCRIVRHFWNSVPLVGRSVLSWKCQAS